MKSKQQKRQEAANRAGYRWDNANIRGWKFFLARYPTRESYVRMFLGNQEDTGK